MDYLITIIVPNYNHSNFLEERLTSIFNQTYQNFEVILLDDASTDNSVSILEHYKSHPKVSHSVFNKTNSGSPFKQWEKGLELARGNYIWIAESDDSCSSEFLESLVVKLKPELALIFCESLVINTNGEKIKRNDWADSLDKDRWKLGYYNSGTNEIEKYLRYKNFIPNASAVIFSKSIASKIKFPENMYYCGDWYIWIELCRLGDIAFVNKTLNYFRKHNATTREVKSFSEELTRFKEYNLVIKRNSTRIERFLNRKKYYWIVDEWLKKSKKTKYADAIKIIMPTTLYLTFIRKYLTYKLKRK